MTDRESFLKAIHNAWQDDTPRLVFADWLDENATGDRDTATAEFIRLSCNSSGKITMPKAAYTWLDANWMRLVPTMFRRCLKWAGKRGSLERQYGRRNGRKVTVQACITRHVLTVDYSGLEWYDEVNRCDLLNRLPIDDDAAALNDAANVEFYVTLDFSRGFMQRAEIWTKEYSDELSRLIVADQPLAKTPFR